MGVSDTYVRNKRGETKCLRPGNANCGVPKLIIVISACLLAAQPTPAASQQSTEAYTYDALGRLVVVNVSGGQNNDEV